jgi:5-carboxymethyl-2-hydroxymuconate isomerase
MIDEILKVLQGKSTAVRQNVMTSLMEMATSLPDELQEYFSKLLPEF